MAVKESLIPSRSALISPDKVTKGICGRNQPVYDIESAQSQLSVFVSLVNVAQSVAIDVGQKHVYEIDPAGPLYLFRYQAYFLRDFEVAFVAYEPCVG